MTIQEEALRLHREWRGKIEVISKVPVENMTDLSLAYTPGVAEPCLEIENDVDLSYLYTRRWNLVAVITDGTAVLGLGDIGPEASMPVMEGKCVLFKTFGDVDAFPLCIRSKEVDDIVNTVKLVSGSFGGGSTLKTSRLPGVLKLKDGLKRNATYRFFMMTSTVPQ